MNAIAVYFMGRPGSNSLRRAGENLETRVRAARSYWMFISASMERLETGVVPSSAQPDGLGNCDL